MRLVAVSRVLDEEELIEPLVRHHAALVDHHIVLDNGSSDGTLPLLGALFAEGHALTVLRNDAVLAAELEYNTALYETASASFGADWVLFLDADEFIDPRGVADLRAYLAALPREAAMLSVGLRDYVAPTHATAGEVNVMQRLIRRLPAAPSCWKVFVRGGFGPGRVAVQAGNHAIALDGCGQAVLPQDDVYLAHYPNRSPYHFAAKAINGRLQVLAGGSARQTQATHYTPAFGALREIPRHWLRHAQDGATALQSADGLIDDPVPYLGKPLRHTRAPDHRLHGFRRLVTTAERMACTLGAAVDATGALRPLVDARGREALPLFGARPDGSQMDYAAILTEAWRNAAEADFARLLGDGWSAPEPWGVWGIGDAHVLHLTFAAAPPRGTWLEAEVSAFIPRGRDSQEVAVFAGGQLLARWDFDRAFNLGVRGVSVPAEAILGQSPCLKLVFRPSFAAAPAQSEPGSSDTRRLGLAMHRVRQTYR